MNSARKKRIGILPVYDHYSCMYFACDRFNRSLHDRRWPHKTGGKNKKGEEGLQNSLAFLQYYRIPSTLIIRLKKDYDFQKNCLELSDSLYEESCND